ncbi:MAG: B12-binding domain-containing radical SAM protein [Planctomycetes bacterium]|nr:B12-binding domain-containing radical SAM protein [Planctomycetota bacterium]
MRVMLVKPNNLSDHIQPSLGLGYLAQQIRRDHDVDIFDCIKAKTTPEQLGKIVEVTQPDLVGIQCYTFDIPNVKRILRAVREVSPRIVTMVGGAHMSSDSVGAMNDFGADLDFGFGGEGEESFPPFLHALEKGAKTFEGIPGVVWRRDGRVIANKQMLISDLDSIGLPAIDLIRPDTYPESQHGAFYDQFPICPIITTRGCPYSCTFCSAPIISGKTLRHHSLDYLRDLIQRLYYRYAIREIHIVDDNFTMDIEYAKSVMQMIIDLNLGISIAMPNGIRMDWLDDELLELMKAAGVYVVSVAVESGNDRILKAMKKATTVAKMRENVALIRRHGLDVAGFFILGFPGETRETIKDTIRLSRQLDLLRANFFTYLPLPGTSSYKQLVRDGELEDVDWDNFLFMTAPYTPKGMTRGELMSLKRGAFLRFHLRPTILIRNLLAIRSYAHFRFLLTRFYHWVCMSPHPAHGMIEARQPWYARAWSRVAGLIGYRRSRAPVVIAARAGLASAVPASTQASGVVLQKTAPATIAPEPVTAISEPALPVESHDAAHDLTLSLPVIR